MRDERCVITAQQSSCVRRTNVVVLCHDVCTTHKPFVHLSTDG